MKREREMKRSERNGRQVAFFLSSNKRVLKRRKRDEESEVTKRVVRKEREDVLFSGYNEQVKDVGERERGKMAKRRKENGGGICFRFLRVRVTRNDDTRDTNQIFEIIHTINGRY